MNCGQARNLFSAYWDDEITQGEREWLESHFSSCPSCRREYDALARTLEALSDLPRVEVSNGFADRVLAAAKRRSPAVDRMPVPVRRWVPITATAVLLAIVAAMVMQWSGMPLGPRHQGSVALEQPVLTQPQPVQTEPATPAMATVTSPDWVARAAGVTDSERKPMPSSAMASSGRAAISPQTDTGTPAMAQPFATALSMASAAGDSAS